MVGRADAVAAFLQRQRDRRALDHQIEGLAKDVEDGLKAAFQIVMHIRRQR